MKKSLLNKMIIYSLSIFLGAILLSVVICTVGNIRRTLTLTTNITKSATQIVSQIAGKYDLEQLSQTPDSEEYREFKETLQSICNYDGVEYVYVYIPDMDNNKVKYVIGVASDECKKNGELEKFQAGAVMEHDFLSGEINAWNGKTEGISSVRSNERYGKQMCTYAIITDQNKNRIALVGADYSIDKIYEEIIIFTAAVFFVKKKIYEPITYLFTNMKNYVSGKIDDNRKFEPLKLNTNDEIQQLADYFNEMVIDIDNYAERVKKLASQQAKADTELEVARRIQYGIVGAKKELCFSDCIMVSARMKSARQVGGDFYDCFLLGNGNVCAFIGDVSDKGIAAALFMVFVKTLLREKLMDIPDLAQAVCEVNRELCNSNPAGMFVTAFVVVVEPDSGKLQYVNAGHNKPVIIHGSKTEFLECSSCMALGVFDDSEYEQHEEEFTSGDLIYLYTDGVTDAINCEKTFFGEENLLNVCRASEHTANEVCVSVGIALRNFMGDKAEQFDDITMLAIEQREKALELSCELPELEKIKSCIFKLPVENGKKKRIFLACEEIFSNITYYSGADHVQFTCNKSTDRIKITFTDNGEKFNPLESKNEKEFEEFDEGGMGISLVKELCSNIKYSNVNGENILSLEFVD